jgi:purine-binding chemotaxis protein CheW
MSQTSGAGRYEEVLRRRAAALARSIEGHEARKREMLVVVVAMGRERLGIPIHGVREIVRKGRVVMLPGQPDWVRGVTSVRGEIVSVVDLAAWLEMGRTDDAELVVVLEGSRGPVALLVDTVMGLREVFEDELVSGLGAAGEEGRPIVATTRDLVSVLDLDRVMANDALVAGGALERRRRQAGRRSGARDGEERER